MTTKLTLDPASPTAQVIAKAAAECKVVDAKGRVITLKKPGILAQYRLIEALGDASKNETYVAMCIPLLYVAAVDSDPVTPLSNKMLVEALIQRMDDAGIEAVMKGVRDHFGASDPEADKAAIKK
jgi:hypothetical protein